MSNIFIYLNSLSAQCGARTQDPEIKRSTLLQLSQLGAPRMQNFWCYFNAMHIIIQIFACDFRGGLGVILKFIQ